MTLEAIDTLAPAGTGFAVANQSDIKGGAHSVATYADLATQPATSRRAAGMLVLVRDTNEVYALGNDLTTWTLASGAGGSAYWLDPVLTLGEDTPPGSPAQDDRHITGTNPQNAWSGNANKIATWNGAAWEFEAPTEGLVVYAHDDDLLYKYSGTAWVEAAVPTARQVIAGNGLSGGGSLTGDVTLHVAATDSTISIASDSIAVGTIANANVATNAAVAVSKLAGGSDNQVLYTSTATPTWGAMTDAIHGTRSGGTQHSAVSNSAAGFAPAVGASGTVLQSTGTAGTWATIGPSNLDDGAIPWTKLIGVSTDILEPAGFTDRTTSTISRVDGTRTFTIAPVSGSFSFYAKGTKFTKNSAQTVTWTNTEGIWFFLFNSSGTLIATQDTSVWAAGINGDGALVAALYWDATNGASIVFLEERHGLMDGPTHSYLHNTAGTQWASGGALGDFVIGNGSLDTHAQLSVSSTTYYDEDIRHVSSALAAPANIPIFYRSGASGVWRKKTANNFPLIYSGTAGYTGANGRIPYNLYSGGTWSLAQASNNYYVCVHYFATADTTAPIIGIQGQTQYATLAATEAGAISEAKGIAGMLSLLSTEYTPLGTVAYQTASYANTPNARIVQLNGANYVDLRGNKLSGTGAAISDHGNLTGLADDDHTQYHLTDGSRATTGNLTFAQAVVSPTIAQANETTNSTNGDPLTLQAQNATGTTSTGGALTLTSGTGTTAAGNVLVQTGGTTRVTVSPTEATFAFNSTVSSLRNAYGSNTDSALFMGSTAVTTPSAQNHVIKGTDTDASFNAPNGSLFLTTGGTTRVGISTGFDFYVNTVQYRDTLQTPVLKQRASSSNSTGYPLTIAGQDCSAGSSTGGKVVITSGTGTSAAGNIELQTGGTTRITLAPTSSVWNHGSGTICTIGAASVALGATPATTGILRLPNNDGIYFRNNGNTADVAGVRCDTGDEVILGNGSSDVVTISTSAATFTVGISTSGNDVDLAGGKLKAADNGSGAGSDLTVLGAKGTTAGGRILLTAGNATNNSTTGADIAITTGSCEGTGGSSGSCTITAGSSVLTTSPSVITCVANSSTHSNGLAGLGLTGQTADITTTNLATTPGAGLYRLDYYVEVTTAGTGGTIDVTLGFTDTIGATTKKIVDALSVSAQGRASGSYVFWVASGSVTYATAFAAKTGSPQYTLRCQLERIR